MTSHIVAFRYEYCKFPVEASKMAFCRIRFRYRLRAYKTIGSAKLSEAISYSGELPVVASFVRFLLLALLQGLPFLRGGRKLFHVLFVSSKASPQSCSFRAHESPEFLPSLFWFLSVFFVYFQKNRTRKEQQRPPSSGSLSNLPVFLF